MPRIEGQTLAEHRSLVQGRILDAFGAEMTVSGFAGLTLAKVAERAGIARNTVYNYAADKNELMLLYVERSVDEFVTEVGREVEELPSARDRMEMLVRAQLASSAVEPGAGSVAGMLEGGSLPAEVFDALMGRLSRLHGMVRQTLEYGIARGEFRDSGDLQATVEMVGAVIGSQRMPIGEGRRTVDEATAQVWPFILQAITA